MSAALPERSSGASRALAMARKAQGALIAAVAVWVLATGAMVLIANAYFERTATSALNAAGDQLAVQAATMEQLVLRLVETVGHLHDLAQARADLLAARESAGARIIERELSAVGREERFGIIQVGVIGADGTIEWSTSPYVPGTPLHEREHFRAHAEDGVKGLFVSLPVVGRASGRVSLQFTRPLRAPGGGFGGVAVVSVDPESLSANLGLLLNSPTERLGLRRWPDGVALARTVDRAAVLAAGPDQAQAPPPLMAAARVAPRGTVTMRSPVDRADLLAVYRVVAGAPLLAVAAERTDSIREAALRPVRGPVLVGVGAASLAVMVVSALALLAMARQRTRMELRTLRIANDTLESARAEIGRLLEGLPTAVYRGVLHADGRFYLLYVSPNADALAGDIAAVLRGPDQGGVSPAPDAGAGRAALLASVRATGRGSAEYDVGHPERGRIWVRDRAHGKLGPDGRIEVIGHVVDITEERRITATAMATAKLATLGEMATGLAHELNQPIAVISLAAENAARALTDPTPRNIESASVRLRRIVDQTARTREIVDHLRIFGRIDEGPVEPIDLNAAVGGALTLVESALRSAGVALRLDLADGLPPVRARRVPVEQVVVNLCVNARDAMQSVDPAQRALSITTARGTAPGTVVLTVLDTGPGIPDSVMSRLFEPFVTTKPSGAGTGLGLSVCLGTMRGFGGDIAARNTGGGAEFVLTFRAADESAAA